MIKIYPNCKKLPLKAGCCKLGHLTDSTFSLWTKDLNEELEGQQLAKILDLHLECMTQEEIGKVVGLSQKQVGIKIVDLQQNIKEIYQNPELEIGIKYEFLTQKIEEIYHFKPQLYNMWNQQSYDADNQHFGKFPHSFMENLLYYYTEPFDIVYDPFAGGGTINGRR